MGLKNCYVIFFQDSIEADQVYIEGESGYSTEAPTKEEAPSADELSPSGGDDTVAPKSTTPDIVVEPPTPTSLTAKEEVEAVEEKVAEIDIKDEEGRCSQTWTFLKSAKFVGNNPSIDISRLK